MEGEMKSCMKKVCLFNKKMYFSGKVLKYYYTVSECLEHIKM